jgi:hypothetical protein
MHPQAAPGLRAVRLQSVTRRQRVELIAVAALITIFASCLGVGAARTGITVDEPGHLVSAFLYWEGRDRLRPRDMPPLIRIVGGWPLQFMNLEVPPDRGQPGELRFEWDEGMRLVGSVPAQRVGAVFFWPRLLLVVFPVLTAGLLWWWSRERFGPAVALCVLTLWITSPTVVGHGSLFKNDHAATCAYLVFWYCGWRLWRRPRLLTAAAFACATAVVLLSKMSMLFLVAVAPVVVLVSFLKQGARSRAAAACVLHAAICYGLLLAAYQFETIRVGSAELEILAEDPAIPRVLLTAMRPLGWLWIPTGMWTGVLNLFRYNETSVAYFLGQVQPIGHPMYFVVALGLKTPLAALALILVGFACAIKYVVARRVSVADLFWIAPGAIYIALASTSALQLGVRLVLPALPFLCLLAGLTFRLLLRTRLGMWSAGALLCVLALECAAWYPNGIAYYNPIAGGARGSLRFLSDSNIDWGHGLPELAKWVEANDIPLIHLSYFGYDRPERYLESSRFDLSMPPWNDTDTKGRTSLTPERGRYYAISASLLPGNLFRPEYRDWYREFWNLEPIATPGGSIFVYRIE